MCRQEKKELKKAVWLHTNICAVLYIYIIVSVHMARTCTFSDDVTVGIGIYMSVATQTIYPDTLLNMYTILAS